MYRTATFSLRLPFLLLPLWLVSGCNGIGDVADSLGNHLPVIGDRCEHWQCFTESGQEQSEMNKRMRGVQESPPQSAATANNVRKPIPQNPPLQAAPAAQGAQPPAPQPVMARGAMPTGKGGVPANPESDPYDFYHGPGELPEPVHSGEE
jgi:hypothetical protein